MLITRFARSSCRRVFSSCESYRKTSFPFFDILQEQFRTIRQGQRTGTGREEGSQDTQVRCHLYLSLSVAVHQWVHVIRLLLPSSVLVVVLRFHLYRYKDGFLNGLPVSEVTPPRECWESE